MQKYPFFDAVFLDDIFLTVSLPLHISRQEGSFFCNCFLKTAHFQNDFDVLRKNPNTVDVMFNYLAHTVQISPFQQLFCFGKRSTHCFIIRTSAFLNVQLFLNLNLQPGLLLFKAAQLVSQSGRACLCNDADDVVNPPLYRLELLAQCRKLVVGFSVLLGGEIGITPIKFGQKRFVKEVIRERVEYGSIQCFGTNLFVVASGGTVALCAPIGSIRWMSGACFSKVSGIGTAAHAACNFAREQVNLFGFVSG